jgi:hypothetical protein
VADERHYDPLGEAGGYVEYFRPLFFSDPPHIVTLPESTPQTVKDDLIASFRLFWSDSDAAANRIRASVEHLLTALRVNRTSGRGNARGSRQFLTLHERIRRFRENEASLADHLLAVKWLGNVGSHPGGITQEDVLDGYEIIQYVLDELYIRRSHRINRLSRAINRRRGPRSPRRGSA